MGCNSSKATDNKRISTDGKTLLKAHTTALDGNPKLIRAGDVLTTASPPDDCDGLSEPAAEPSVDTTREAGTGEPINVERGQSQISTQAENEHEDACRNVGPQMTEAEITAQCEVVDPTGTRMAEITKPCEPIEQKEERAVPVKEKSSNNLLPLLFRKGDVVIIIGPTANGNLELQGKIGRVVQVDGGSIPYEVLVEKEKAWFKPSSLEKPATLNVTVTSTAKNDACCCTGTPGFLQCCADAKR